MSELSEFQARHGRSWAELLSSPAFSAALALASQEKIQSILNLTDDDIALKAPIILSDLRGHLRYEAALVTFHEKKEFVFQQLGEEEYQDPEREEFEQSQRSDEPGQELPPTPKIARKPTTRRKAKK